MCGKLDAYRKLCVCDVIGLAGPLDEVAFEVPALEGELVQADFCPDEAESACCDVEFVTLLFITQTSPHALASPEADLPCNSLEFLKGTIVIDHIMYGRHISPTFVFASLDLFESSDDSFFELTDTTFLCHPVGLIS